MSIKDLIFRLVALNVEECFLLVIKVSLTNRSHDNKSSGKPLYNFILYMYQLELRLESIWHLIFRLVAQNHVHRFYSGLRSLRIKIDLTIFRQCCNACQIFNCRKFFTVPDFFQYMNKFVTVKCLQKFRIWRYPSYFLQKKLP